jgi:hypothetical protein
LPGGRTLLQLLLQRGHLLLQLGALRAEGRHLLPVLRHCFHVLQLLLLDCCHGLPQLLVLLVQPLHHLLCLLLLLL